MSIKLQQFDFDKSPYQRPTQKWVCGHAAEGDPCRLGPDRNGRCRATFQCMPSRRGDRWHCTRPDDAGGNCDQGPRPDGTCCLAIPPCQPVRSLRAKRGRLTGLACTATIGALAVLVFGPWSSAFISPGPLTTTHAINTDDCTACHTADVIAFLTNASDAEVRTDSNRCQTCHDLGSSAMFAHSMPPDTLAAVSLASGAPSDSHVPLRMTLARSLGGDTFPTNGSLACATCHQEHRGRQFNLLELSNQRCQSCHQRQFESFSHGHPEFSAEYPTIRRTRIAFSHANHYGKHFVDKDWSGDCMTCHAAEPTGARMLMRPFEAMCGTCHNHRIDISGAALNDPTVPMIALPGVDLEAFEDRGIWLGDGDSAWPADLDDGYEGIPPLMRLLLSSDEDIARDLELFEDPEVLLDLSFAEDDAIVEAAGRVLWAIKGLIFDLIKGGEEALADRIEQTLGVALSPSERAAIVGQPADIPRASHQGWRDNLQHLQANLLPMLMADVPKYRANPELLTGDPCTSHPASDTVDSGVTMQDAEATLESLRAALRDGAGWSLDTEVFAVRYRPAGHADPFLRSWLDRTAGSISTPAADAAHDVFDMLRAEYAPGRCTKCHSIDATSVGPNAEYVVNWISQRPRAGERRFTTFDHGPHLSLAQFRDCTSCHSLHTIDVETRVEWKGRYSDPNPHESLMPGFDPIPSSKCTECHTPRGATDSCLACHDYHVGSFNQRVPRTAKGGAASDE